jgi:hypothetical protein
LHRLQQLLKAKAGEGAPINGLALGVENTQLAGNGYGSELVIAGYHEGAIPAWAAAGYGFPRFGPRGIVHAH